MTPKSENNHTTRRQRQDSDTSHDSVADYIPTPPDGGWGWVVVGASLVCNIIVDGMGYTFGIWILTFVDHFQSSKGKTALVGSLLSGIYLCAGPIVSGLVNKFGCRAVTIAGSLLSSAAFLLATLSPSIEILALTYGAMGGFGFGLIYLPSIVSVGFYFEKKRALTTGIAVCGSGIGLFVFAPLVRYLLEIYDWKNALYIMSGIVLNGVVCGMLMRPLQAPIPKRKPKPIYNGNDRHKRKSKDQVVRERYMSENDMNGEVDRYEIMEKLQEAKLEREKQLQDNDSDIASLPSAIFVKGLIRTDSKSEPRVRQLSNSERGSSISHQISGSDRGDNFSSHPGSPDSVPRIVVDDFDTQKEISSMPKLSSDDVELTDMSNKSNKGSKSAPETPMGEPMSPEEMAALLGHQHNSLPRKVLNSSANGYPSSDLPIVTSPDGSIFVIQKKTSTTAPKNTEMRSLEDHAHLLSTGDRYQLVVRKEDYARPMYRKDIFYSGSVLNIPQFQSQPDMRSYITSVTTIPDGNFARLNDCWLWEYVCLPKAAKDTCKEMLDVSLFTNPSFMFICLGNILAFMGFYVPFVYTVDRAQIHGIPQADAAFLLSVIGITNTIGRIISGVFADFGKLSALAINNIALVIAGCATMIAPFCLTYPWMCVYTSIFGLCIAAFVSLTSIILCDLLGLEKLTNAFGLLTLARGLSAVTGPPLMGYIFDETGSYDNSFWIAGALIICGGISHSVLYLPCFKKHLRTQTHEIVALTASDPILAQAGGGNSAQVADV